MDGLNVRDTADDLTAIKDFMLDVLHVGQINTFQMMSDDLKTIDISKTMENAIYLLRYLEASYI